MNKIVESINFASDAYWGDPEKFNFRAMIDNYTTSTEMSQGQDRTVKTSFEIKMMGHIVPDSINTSIANMNKFYSKSSVKFGLEVAGTEEILNVASTSPASQAPSGRFYDSFAGRTETTINQSGMTQSERTYLAINRAISSSGYETVINSSDNSIFFPNVSIAVPPANFPTPTIDDFQVFINGSAVAKSNITSIEEDGTLLKVDFAPSLGFTITDEMEIVVTGKLVV